MKKIIWISPLVPFSLISIIITLLLIQLAGILINNIEFSRDIEVYILTGKYAALSGLSASIIILIVGLIMNHKIHYSISKDSISFKNYNFKLSDIAKLRIDSVTKRESISNSTHRMVDNTYYSLIIYYFLDDYSEEEKSRYRKLYDENPDEYTTKRLSRSIYNSKARFGSTHSISLGNTRVLFYLLKKAEQFSKVVNLPVKFYSVGSQKSFE